MLRRTPLVRHTELKRGDSELKRHTPMNRYNAERQEKDFARHFGPPGFVEWSHTEPCVCEGKGQAWGCKGGPTVVSHDPSRGAGGTWKNTHPATDACHRKIGAGAETFWRLIGKTREQANRAHHMRWLAHVDGEAA